MPLDYSLQSQGQNLPVHTIASIGINKSQQQIKNSVKDVSFPVEDVSSYEVLRLRGGMFLAGESSNGIAPGVWFVRLNPAVSPFLQKLNRRMNSARRTQVQAILGTSRTSLQASRSYLQSEYIKHKTYGHSGPVQIINAFYVPAEFIFSNNERGLALSAITNHSETFNEKTLKVYLTRQNNKKGQPVANIMTAKEIKEVSLRAVKLIKFTRGLAR